MKVWIYAMTFPALLATSCTRRIAVSGAWPAGIPQSPSAVSVVMKRQVRNAVEAGEGDHRIRILRQRVLADPGNLEARLELARACEQAGSPELAIEHYRLAAERFPNNEELHILLVKSLRSQGLLREASETLSRFLEHNPGLRKPDAYSWLGILLDEQGFFEEAEQMHRAALSKEPGADYLHNNLGYNLLLQGKREEAAREFRRCLELRPHSEIARNNLGLAIANNPKEAVLHWQSVSDPATAHNNLAAVLIEQGRFREARKELSIALGYKRDHPAALRNLQLVSELDGGEAALEVEPQQAALPWWKRWGRSIGRYLANSPSEKERTGDIAAR